MKLNIVSTKNYIRTLSILVKKEFVDYFISAIAYLVIILFTVFVGIIFVKDVFVSGIAEMRNVFNLIPVILIFLIPALTMRSFAEERQSGTFEILLTAPVSVVQVLLSKFLATLFFVFIIIIAIVPIPIALNSIGQPNNTIIFAGYLGLVLLSASYIGIGQLISINTTNQISAFLLSVVVIGFFYIIGMSEFLKYLPTTIRDFISYFSLKTHFESVIKGVIDSRDMVYYICILFLTMFATHQSILRIKSKGK